MARRRVMICCGLLSAVLALALDAAPPRPQSPTPPSPLPQLALDGLPTGVRTAIERAHAAARASPDDSAAVGALATLLHAYEQYGTAAEIYSLLRRLDPRSAAWPYLAGVVEAERGAHSAAVDALRGALQIDPDHLPARVKLADVLLQQGQLDASREAYAALLADVPELALAHYGLGRIASLRNDTRAALDHYARAVKLAPQFGAAHYALALAYRNAGQDDRAAPHLAAHREFGVRRPAVRDPLLERIRGLRETARDLIAEGAKLADAGRLDAAIAAQLRALELDAASAQAHVNLIALYGRAGRPEHAKRHYDAAVALGTSLADAHYNYGVLLAGGRRFPEAAAMFRQALQVDPFHAAAHNNLAALLAAGGDFAAAAAHYEQALANDPQHRTARLNLGRALVRLGRTTEAIAQLELALRRAERASDLELASAIRDDLRRAKERR